MEDIAQEKKPRRGRRRGRVADPGGPGDDAKTTQTTTMPRSFYYGFVVPYLAKRAEAGLPSTWNWLSIEAVRQFIEDDDGEPGPAPEAVHNTDRRFATLEHGGVARTVSEWSKVRGIPRQKILARMSRGWTSAQVLGLEEAPTQARTLTVNGERGTLAHWTSRYPVSADQVKYRLRHGWSDEDAVLTPPGEPRGTRAAWSPADIKASGDGA
jgi:hypothetical protein